MSTIVNARYLLLQATVPRLLPIPNAMALLDSTARSFHVNTPGVADPTSITFTARLIAIDGVVTFSAVGGTLSSVSGNTCVLLYSNMSSPAATVTATIVYRGQTYSATSYITKVYDGNVGADGARGAGTYYATGTAWSDAVADAATPGANVVDDVVTISNGSTYINTKKWSGSAWVAISATIDGNLLVTGTVTAAKLNVFTLSSVAADLGNATISSGGSLSSGQTSYNTGTGFWWGSVAGTPKMSIGTAGGQGLKWDGSTLTITGNLLGASGSFSGVLTASQVVTTDNIVNNAVTVPLSETRTDAMAGIGADQTVMSKAITLTQTGQVQVMCTCSQGSGAAPYGWSLTLRINGTSVCHASGANPADSVALSGAMALAAGTYIIDLIQNSGSGSFAQDRNLTILGAMR